MTARSLHRLVDLETPGPSIQLLLPETGGCDRDCLSHLSPLNVPNGHRETILMPCSLRSIGDPAILVDIDGAVSALCNRSNEKYITAFWRQNSDVNCLALALNDRASQQLEG